MAIFGGFFLIILLIFLINKYLNDPKYYNPDDFFLKKDKNGKIVLEYKKFIFDGSLVENTSTISTDYQNFYPKDLKGKKVRKVVAKRVQNYLKYYKHRIINNLREIEYKEKAYNNEQFTKTVDYGIDKKFNRKYLLIIILSIFILVFVFGSYFIYDVLPDNRKIASSVLIIGLGIIEFILWAFVATDPYFQNSEDFKINEIEDGNKKIINIRYKDYEFEIFDRFDIKHLKNIEKNDKHVSVINRYKIKRYYKYALLNILNKPMDLKNIEQYKSVRRATDDEILEYREILEKRRKTNIWKDVPALGYGVIGMIFFTIIISIVGVINEEDVTLVIFAICATIILFTIIILCLGFTNTFEIYEKKQRKSPKKILQILKEGQVFIVEAKELVHKFSTVFENNRRT